MEFSELVEALDKDNTSKVNNLLKKLTPRLVRFLQIHMNAEKQDAEDCAQEALLKALKTIREDKMRNSEHILSFLLTSCRNNYLNLMNKQKDRSLEDYSRGFGRQPRQLLAMLDKERKRLLEWCMQQLSDDYKQFIDYWFTYPDSDATAVASHFDISVNNAWTRKHRIIKKLNKCYEEKNSI